MKLLPEPSFHASLGASRPSEPQTQGLGTGLANLQGTQFRPPTA